MKKSLIILAVGGAGFLLTVAWLACVMGIMSVSAKPGHGASEGILGLGACAFGMLVWAMSFGRSFAAPSLRLLAVEAIALLLGFFLFIVLFFAGVVPGVLVCVILAPVAWFLSSAVLSGIYPRKRQPQFRKLYLKGQKPVEEASGEVGHAAEDTEERWGNKEWVQFFGGALLVPLALFAIALVAMIISSVM